MEERKSKLGLGIFIGVLIGLVIGLTSFIVYDKVIDKGSNDTKLNDVGKDINNSDNKTTDDTKNNDSNNSFDLSKVDFKKPAINGKSGDVYDVHDEGIDYMSIELSNDNTVIISIDFSKYGIYFENFKTENSIKKYVVDNFTKKVKKAYLFPYTTSGGSIAALYLMEDGTVEYTLIYEQLENDPTVTSMKSSGKILNVNGVEELVFAYKSNTLQPLGLYGAGYELAIKKDGTFYEITF